MSERPNGLTYAQAGVDIDAGEALVEAIKPLAKATRRPGADAALGGFGALFDLKAAGFSDPLLVSTTASLPSPCSTALTSNSSNPEPTASGLGQQFAIKTARFLASSNVRKRNRPCCSNAFAR